MSQITQVSTDDKLIDMWLHGRPSRTVDIYQRAVDKFTTFMNKPLSTITLEELQSYASRLSESGLKDSTVKLELNAVKSLFTFAAKLNYVRFNTAAALRIKKPDYTISGKCIKQSDVFKIINKGTNNPRDKALLQLLYFTGMRVSELCRLIWGDFNEREDGEIQVNILGKGNKRRTVLVPLTVWTEVEALRGELKDKDAVFRSKSGKHLDRATIHKIIKDAVKKVGASDKISAHAFRHPCLALATERGADKLS